MPSVEYMIFDHGYSHLGIVVEVYRLS